jgi:hypothetical protein
VFKRSCKTTKQDGTPCLQAPLQGEDFASGTTRTTRTEADQARRLGGQRRRREGTLGAVYDLEGLSTLPEIRRLVEVAAFDTLGLENSIARARTLAYLAQVAGALFERSELEERLEAIESTLGPRLMAPDLRRRQA